MQKSNSTDIKMEPNDSIIEDKSNPVEEPSPLYNKTDNILNKLSGGVVDYKNEVLGSDSASDNVLLHSYCRLGLESNKNNGLTKVTSEEALHKKASSIEKVTPELLVLPSKPASSVKGYVPHRHFDSKMLKED